MTNTEMPYQAHKQEARDYPEYLHTQSQEELLRRELADKRLYRKAECPLERQEVRNVLYP